MIDAESYQANGFSSMLFNLDGFVAMNPDADEDDSNFLKMAASMANKRISEMESDNFFSPRCKAYKQADPNDFYSLGTIRAENLSDTDA